MTHIEEGVEDELDIVVDHGSDADRYEVRIIEHRGCIVGSRLGSRGIRVVDDLNGIIEDKIVGDDIIPEGSAKT